MNNKEVLENGIQYKGDTGASGSGSSSGGIVFNDSYISNANLWLTNGYTKTSGRETINLPPVCTTGRDKWGILFFIAENVANRTGTQMFFPIDGAYIGKIFTRSIVNGTPSTWSMLASEDNIIETVVQHNGAIILSSRMYQKIDATGNIAITLPAINSPSNSNYKEIHLFYWSESTYTVTVAASNNKNIFWESIPTLEARAITEFIFIFKGDNWICRGITYKQQ